MDCVGARERRIWDAATAEVKNTLEWYRNVYSVLFDTTGLCLATYIGCIKVDAVPLIDAKDPIQSQPHEAQQYGYSLSPNKSWITGNGHTVLWLAIRIPTFKTPKSSHLAARTNAVDCGEGCHRL